MLVFHTSRFGQKVRIGDVTVAVSIETDPKAGAHIGTLRWCIDAPSEVPIFRVKDPKGADISIKQVRKIKRRVQHRNGRQTHG